MSKISPIADNIEWSALAAAADVVERVKHDSPFIALWLNEQGELCWSKANMTKQAYAYFSMALHEFGADWLRKSIK